MFAACEDVDVATHRFECSGRGDEGKAPSSRRKRRPGKAAAGGRPTLVPRAGATPCSWVPAFAGMTL
jgi:hypothetical protein